MVTLAHRRALMTLYTRPACPSGHRVRLVLAEKGITNIDVVEIRDGDVNEDFVHSNPHQILPTVVDRDLVLYDPRIIVEYLDERFPHPPLMPVDPVMRARHRLALMRMEADLYALAASLEDAPPAQARKSRRHLGQMLAALAADFTPKRFVGEEFSLVDCSLAPILWRLAHYRVELPPAQGKRLADYAQRLFNRPAFKASLTTTEAEMRGAAPCRA